jgi:hypothetical protein
MDTIGTQIHETSLSGLGTCTSINSGVDTLVLWAATGI